MNIVSPKASHSVPVVATPCFTRTAIEPPPISLSILSWFDSALGALKSSVAYFEFEKVTLLYRITSPVNWTVALPVNASPVSGPMTYVEPSLASLVVKTPSPNSDWDNICFSSRLV